VGCQGGEKKAQIPSSGQGHGHESSESVAELPGDVPKKSGEGASIWTGCPVWEASNTWKLPPTTPFRHLPGAEERVFHFRRLFRSFQKDRKRIHFLPTLLHNGRYLKAFGAASNSAFLFPRFLLCRGPGPSLSVSDCRLFGRSENVSWDSISDFGTNGAIALAAHAAFSFGAPRW
jgi:hypothetical protein